MSGCASRTGARWTLPRPMRRTCRRRLRARLRSTAICRELQIPVKSLSLGDKLEYQVRYVRKKSTATGQFWGALNFVRSNVVLEETVEMSFPKDKYVLVLSPRDKADIAEENGLKVYRWKTSQLEPTLARTERRMRRIRTGCRRCRGRRSGTGRKSASGMDRWRRIARWRALRLRQR